MAPSPGTVSVIIPLYNEKESIGGVLTELQAVVERHNDRIWEIIVVDDGSTDDSFREVEKFKNVTLLTHPYNRGYGAALKTGFRNASHEIVVTLDADGQHVPSEIEKLLGELRNGYDMVVGCRADHKSSPASRLIGKWALHKLVNYLLGEKIPDLNPGFRAIRRDVILRYLHLCSNQFSFSTTSTMVLHGEGYFIKFLNVEYRPRLSSTSSVTPFTGLKVMLLFLRVIMIYNPLKIFFPISLIFGLTGTILLVWDLTQRNIHDVTVLTLVLAVLIFLFGLVADQVAHIRRGHY